MALMNLATKYLLVIALVGSTLYALQASSLHPGRDQADTAPRKTSMMIDHTIRVYSGERKLHPTRDDT